MSDSASPYSVESAVAPRRLASRSGGPQDPPGSPGRAELGLEMPDLCNWTRGHTFEQPAAGAIEERIVEQPPAGRASPLATDHDHDEDDVDDVDGWLSQVPAMWSRRVTMLVATAATGLIVYAVYDAATRRPGADVQDEFPPVVVEGVEAPRGHPGSVADKPATLVRAVADSAVETPTGDAEASASPARDLPAWPRMAALPEAADRSASAGSSDVMLIRIPPVTDEVSRTGEGVGAGYGPSDPPSPGSVPAPAPPTSELRMTPLDGPRYDQPAGSAGSSTGPDDVAPAASVAPGSAGEAHRVRLEAPSNASDPNGYQSRWGAAPAVAQLGANYPATNPANYQYPDRPAAPGHALAAHGSAWPAGDGGGHTHESWPGTARLGGVEPISHR